MDKGQNLLKTAEIIEMMVRDYQWSDSYIWKIWQQIIIEHFLCARICVKVWYYKCVWGGGDKENVMRIINDSHSWFKSQYRW